MSSISPVHLIIGHGGAGVSTVAAASAVEPLPGPAERGGRTLLVSFDRFRSASRIFGVFSFPGQPIPVSKTVDLLELDSLATLSEAWGQVRAALITGGASFAGTKIVDMHPDELTQLPGIEQLLLLRRIRDESRSGKWERIIVDCSGGAEPIDLLRVPQVITDHMERMWPRHRRLAAAGEMNRTARAVAVMDLFDADCRDIDRLITESGAVQAQVVASPTPHGVETSERLLAALQLMGIPVVDVAVNMVAADDWPANVRKQQRQSGKEIDALLPGKAVATRLPWLPTAPRTVLKLRKLGVHVPESGAPGLVGPGPRTPDVQLESGSGLESVYRMTWRQPLPDPDTLRLGRSGDDVMIALSGIRQRVPLPSVLRRCVVIDASWDDGDLSIRFAPDPKVWPQRAAPRPQPEPEWPDDEELSPEGSH